jgi:hypothetical protein
MGKPLIDLSGKTFGRLTVLEKAGNSGGKAVWLCQCKCGTKKEIRGVHLRKGRQVSCGCYRSENTAKCKTKHGHAKSDGLSPTYIVWQNMINRCKPENADKYPHYKDIDVCERWLSFENFLCDMGERPEGLTIDRIDGTKGYQKDNCRWVDMATQNRNRRDNVWIRFADKILCRTDAMKAYGMRSVKGMDSYAKKHNLFVTNDQLVELTS